MADRVALVTGASLGIGAGTALALARAGYKLVVTATRAENLNAVAARIRAIGGEVAALVLDLRAQESITTAARAALDAYGHIDVLVNNAGVTLRRRVIDVTPAEWNEVIAINLTGTFFLTQQVGRHWIERQQPGVIVNMASTHGLVGFATRAVYGISKAGILQMTRMLAIEWAEHAIRVNAIAPGRVESGSQSRAANLADPSYMQMAMARVPLRRSATIEEVAQAVCYLASPQARYVTGQTLVLDGGLTAQ